MSESLASVKRKAGSGGDKITSLRLTTQCASPGPTIFDL
jgi:hypothetical protein